MSKLEEYTAAYRICRDRLELMDDEYKKRIKPLLDLKASLEGWFDNFLTTTGATNVATPSGTVHWNTRYTASLEDGEAFMEHVKATKDFDLMERRANATAVRDYAEKHGALPPGVKLSTLRTVGVKKPTAKRAKTAATAAVTTETPDDHDC